MKATIQTRRAEWISTPCFCLDRVVSAFIVRLVFSLLFPRAPPGRLSSLLCGGRMSKPATALVVRARDGDRAAFEELVRRTSRLVFARLYLDTGRIDRAEDLLQETLLLAYRSLHALAKPEGFRPWLLSIAHN